MSCHELFSRCNILDSQSEDITEKQVPRKQEDSWVDVTWNGSLQQASRALLTAQGRQYVEANFASNAGRDDAEPGGSPAGVWSVCYDTKMLALLRRGLWLTEQDGQWSLQMRDQSEGGGAVAQEATGSGCRGSTSKTIVGDQILPYIRELEAALGQAPPRPGEAEATQSSDAYFDRTLAKHGIRPFLRFRTRRRAFGAVLAPPRGWRGRGAGAKLAVDLEHTCFDTTYAEPAAVGSLLDAFGEDFRERALTLTVATFKGPTGGAGTPSQIEGFRREHGLDEEGGGSRPGSSVIDEYLLMCRPAHRRALLHAGIRLGPGGPEDAPPRAEAQQADLCTI